MQQFLNFLFFFNIIQRTSKLFKCTEIQIKLISAQIQDSQYVIYIYIYNTGIQYLN